MRRQYRPVLNSDIVFNEAEIAYAAVRAYVHMSADRGGLDMCVGTDVDVVGDAERVVCQGLALRRVG